MEDINYFVAVSHLSEDINPQESYHKASLTDLYRKFALWILCQKNYSLTSNFLLQVKTDMILLMLRKVTEKKTWPYVTEREKKKEKE